MIGVFSLEVLIENIMCFTPLSEVSPCHAVVKSLSSSGALHHPSPSKFVSTLLCSAVNKFVVSSSINIACPNLPSPYLGTPVTTCIPLLVYATVGRLKLTLI